MIRLCFAGLRPERHPRRRRPLPTLTSLVALFLLLAPTARALPITQPSDDALTITEPIVFDFEDGLQGWELNGVQRVQTQLLGAERAMFGDGFLSTGFDGPSLTLVTNLIKVGSISLEAFFLNGEAGDFTLMIEGSNFHIHRAFQVVQPGNPSVLAVALGNGRVISDFRILRRDITFPFPSDSDLVAFIDNITFHPVPEPGTLLLLAMSLAAFGASCLWGG